jgi:hypothetical protein
MSNLITPAQVRQKALKFWHSGGFLRALASGEEIFPWEVRFAKPTASALIDQFGEIREWIRELKAYSKESRGFGYRVEYRDLNHRQLGAQSVPAQILIDDAEDFIRLIGKQKEYDRFEKLKAATAARRPELLAYLREKPLKILEHAEAWNGLLNVCEHFLANPRPGQFIRQLDIPGTDTKFIEQNRGILSELLDRVLPDYAIDPEESGAGRYGFERRFGLLHDQPLIRIRILDPNLTVGGLEDLSVTLPDFARLNLSVDAIFITENKINGLAFPKVPRAAVIFGLGYGIRSITNIDWLKTRPIYYWGDIDTHGFAILSQLRGYYPQTRSLLMERSTLVTFRRLCVEEEESKRETRPLGNLTDPERALYEDLVENRLGRHLRLEQERVGFGYLERQLASIFDLQDEEIKPG